MAHLWAELRVARRTRSTTSLSGGVAQRLVRLAGIVGRENVIGGTDCGFAQGAFLQRVHPEIQWSKLEALAEGARIATEQLWGARAGVA